MGARIEDVKVALKGSFEAEGWHGPAVLENLRGLSSLSGGLKPRGAHHSIHELVDHIEYWEAVGVHYLEKGRPPRRLRRDWAIPRSSFSASLRRLKATHKRLLRAISGLKDDDLRRTVRITTGERVPLARVLHGLAAHAAYHGGQIGLLRTVVESAALRGGAS